MADDDVPPARSLFEALAESAPDAILTIDTDSTILSANRAVLRIFGFSPEELVGRPLTLLMPDRLREQHRVGLARYLASGAKRIPWSGTRLTGLTRDRREIPIEISFGEFIDPGGRRVFSGFVRDVSDRVRLEEQLLHAQKMDAIGRLAGGIAHDFNNLLTVISANADFLAGHIAPGTEAAGDLQEIAKAATRAAQLTRQLLAFSRQSAMDARPLCITTMLAELERMLGRLIGKQLDLAVEQEPDVPIVLADQGQLEQAVVNLVVNARDAMPQGGSIRITCATALLARDYEASTGRIPSGRYAAIAVADTGQGMSPEVRARIFEPFFTTKDMGKGTGLGLATVYGIVKQFRGYVDVQSEVGRGSTFTLYLPAVESAAAPM
jgi:PAS domain S-box-containing protein